MTYRYLRHAGAVALASSFVALAVASASAADLTRDDEPSYKDSPAIVAFPNWSGFYAGGHIGGGWRDGGSSATAQGGAGGGGGGGGGDNNKDKNIGYNNGGIGGNGGAGSDVGLGGAGGNTADSLNAPLGHQGGDGGTGGLGGIVSGDSVEREALIGGLHLGYNWQRENLVVGVEGDISFDGGLDNYLGSLRARLGVANNDMLFYVTGGLALRDSGGSGSVALAGDGAAGGEGGDNDDGVFGDNPSENGQLGSRGGNGAGGGSGGSASSSGSGGGKGGDTGFVIGGGVEYMLSSNVSAGVEGLWYSFEEDGGDDDEVSVIRARLTMHFDRAAHPSFKDGMMSASVADWSGFYAGANFGAAFGDGPASVKTANGGDGVTPEKAPWSGTSGNTTDGWDEGGGGGGGGGGGAAALVSTDNNSGILGGLHLGYNWQDGDRVYGIEGDADLADGDFRDYLASLRVRLGHSFDNVLVYGTAGVAFAGRSGAFTSVSLDDAENGGRGTDGAYENDPNYAGSGGAGGTGGDGGTASVASDGGDEQVGFVVGGGFEVKLWEATSFGVEGLYYGFDGEDAKSTASSYQAGSDLSTAVVRARMSFHLNGEQDGLK